MENPTKLVIVIKAANQKCPDFTVQCESNWSVKYLKSYLSRNYPAKPNEKTIRLIYSGKLLNDDSELKDCVRMNTENNVHNLHIVYKSTNSTDNEQQNIPTTSINSTINSTQQNESNINTQILNQETLNNLEQMNPKEQHTFIYNQLKNYYESIGVAMTNSWNITYLHHTALYYQMYANYMRSMGVNTTFNINNNNNNLNASINNTNLNNNTTLNENNNNNNQANAQNAQQAPAIDPELRAEERDDDWLSLLHNFCSFIVLFSIVYFYSTLTRFMIVFIAVILLMLYHGGWFALERRNARNNANRQNQAQPNDNNNNNNNVNNNNEDNNNQAQNNEQNNNNNNNNNLDNNNNNLDNNNNNNNNATTDQTNASSTTQQIQNPSVFRLIFSFIITFFTSLIPERARIPNN